MKRLRLLLVVSGLLLGLTACGGGDSSPGVLKPLGSASASPSSTGGPVPGAGATPSGSAGGASAASPGALVPPLPAAAAVFTRDGASAFAATSWRWSTWHHETGETIDTEGPERPELRQLQAATSTRSLTGPAGESAWFPGNRLIDSFRHPSRTDTATRCWTFVCAGFSPCHFQDRRSARTGRTRGLCWHRDGVPLAGRSLDRGWMADDQGLHVMRVPRSDSLSQPGPAGRERLDQCPFGHSAVLCPLPRTSVSATDPAASGHRKPAGGPATQPTAGGGTGAGGVPGAPSWSRYCCQPAPATHQTRTGGSAARRCPVARRRARCATGDSHGLSTQHWGDDAVAEGDQPALRVPWCGRSRRRSPYRRDRPCS